MTKLTSQNLDSENDSEFVEMIKWYNSQVFDWYKPNNRDTGKARGGDSPGSSGIDEIMIQMGDMDIHHSEMEPQDYGEGFSMQDSEPIHSAGTQVCCNFFLSLIQGSDSILSLLNN